MDVPFFFGRRLFDWSLEEREGKGRGEGWRGAVCVEISPVDESEGWMGL